MDDLLLLCTTIVGKPGRIGVLHFVCVLLAASILTGCELIRMRVDPSLADVPALKANQWRMPTTPVRFGQWHTTEMKVGSEKTRVRGVSSRNFTAVTAAQPKALSRSSKK